MRASLTLIALTATVGCSSPSYDYSGYKTYDHFPLDGERYWNYQSASQDYLMDVRIDSTESVGDTAVRTLRYENANLASVLYWIKWSSDSGNGVQIHGYMVEETSSVGPDDGTDTGDASTDAVVGTWVNFDPPIAITDHQMTPGETIETAGGDATYTSTFAAVETCDNNWADTSWECLKIVIESNEAEPPPFVGTWHWATEFGTSLFQPAGATSPWILTDYEWDRG
tara:strand:+ start:944 stop:1621 length:678 start_codon:yes stop_codon:yes gene_type:complete